MLCHVAGTSFTHEVGRGKEKTTCRLDVARASLLLTTRGKRDEPGTCHGCGGKEHSLHTHTKTTRVARYAGHGVRNVDCSSSDVQVLWAALRRLADAATAPLLPQLLLAVTAAAVAAAAAVTSSLSFYLSFSGCSLKRAVCDTKKCTNSCSLVRSLPSRSHLLTWLLLP